MIVDCHTHISFDSDESRLLEHVEAMGKIDACIVLGPLASSSKDVNTKLAGYISKYSDKMFGFGVVNPIKDDISAKALTTMTEKQGLSGVVLYCCGSGFHPTHSRAIQFYELVQEAGMPLFFHNWGHMSAEAVMSYAQPYLLDEVARGFPELKIVIGSMGQPFLEQTLSIAAKHSNVYADLTVQPGNVWQVYNTVVSAYEKGVMDKIFFGSGFPRSKPEECIETLLGFNKLLADTNLPTVPRDSIRNIIERDSLGLLGIKR
ncbi:MAG: amidohydrolase family protein [Planctomycetota bacterium]|jgi:predicted TIM-barrel fold metal-dependent hydrolase